MAECVLCKMMAIATPPRPPEEVWKECFERAWMSAYVRGVCDALTEYTFTFNDHESPVCERHAQLFVNWLGQYVNAMAGYRDVHALTAKVSELFGCTALAVPIDHGKHDA